MNTNKLIGDGFKGNFMLVSLQMRVFAGRKTDKDAGRAATNNAGAMDGSAKVIKDLFAGADTELKAAKAAYGAVRNYVYEATTPWATNEIGAQRGPRLLPTQKSIEFMKTYNTLAQEAAGAVKVLEAVYPTRVQSAMTNLGTLGHADEYPDVSELAGLFSLQLDFDSVPDSQDFSGMDLPPQVATYLVNKMEQRQGAAVNNATENVRGRILSELGRITEQMSKVAAGEKTRLYGSLITNVESLAGLMRSLNVAQDPDVEAMVARIEKELCSHTIDEVKNSGSLPAALAVDSADLAKALAEMSLY